MLRLLQLVACFTCGLAVLLALAAADGVLEASLPWLQAIYDHPERQRLLGAAAATLALFYLLVLLLSRRARRPGGELVLQSPDGEIRLAAASLEVALAGRLAADPNVRRARVRLAAADGELQTRGSLVLEATLALRDAAQLARTQFRVRQAVRLALPAVILSHRPVKINVIVEDLGQFAAEEPPACAAGAPPLAAPELAERELRKTFAPNPESPPEEGAAAGS